MSGNVSDYLELILLENYENWNQGTQVPTTRY